MIARVRKKLKNFNNEVTEIPAQNLLPDEVPKGVLEREKPIVVTKLPKLGSEEREKRIVAPKLPKMRGKKKL